MKKQPIRRARHPAQARSKSWVGHSRGRLLPCSSRRARILWPKPNDRTARSPQPWRGPPLDARFVAGGRRTFPRLPILGCSRRARVTEAWASGNTYTDARHTRTYHKRQKTTERIQRLYGQEGTGGATHRSRAGRGRDGKKPTCAPSHTPRNKTQPTSARRTHVARQKN